jgi:hypothetical protein
MLQIVKKAEDDFMTRLERLTFRVYTKFSEKAALLELQPRLRPACEHEIMGNNNIRQFEDYRQAEKLFSSYF